MAGDYLAADNIHTLEQAISILRAIDEERYCHRFADAFDSGPGDQFRHIFDYYVLLMKGWPARCIDYGRCARDRRFEIDRGYALDQLHAMIGALKTIDVSDGRMPVRVYMDSGCGRRANWNCSTLARELNLLVHHDRHHFTLIAFMLRQLDWQPPYDFGYMSDSPCALV